MCSKASDSKLTNWERKATILDPGGGGGALLSSWILLLW